jgi:hypothetical protein
VDDDLHRLGENQTELPEDFSRLSHHSRSIVATLIPRGREAEQSGRITRTKSADDQMMSFLVVGHDSENRGSVGIGSDDIHLRGGAVRCEEKEKQRERERMRRNSSNNIIIRTEDEYKINVFYSD